MRENLFYIQLSKIFSSLVLLKPKMSLSQLVIILVFGIISNHHTFAYQDRSNYKTYPPITQANLGDFPFAVRVRALKANNEVYRECIGVILSANWILTEARCNGVLFDLTFGAVNFDAPGIHRVDRRTSNWTIHPQFNEEYSKVRDYNFGLLNFAEPVEFNEFIQPIALPFLSRNDHFAGINVTFVTAYFDESKY